jgi:hypothetical protein
MREDLKQARSYICLLGGSNSLISTGIRAGLSTYANVINLALGATTSTQNIYELTRAHNRMMSDIDCIVTESNINDAHAIHTADLPAVVVRENISKLYRELALTGKFTVALLLPIRQYLNSSPPADLAAQVMGMVLSSSSEICFRSMNSVNQFSVELPFSRTGEPATVAPSAV